MKFINTIILNHDLNQKSICRYANNHGYTYILATPICNEGQNFVLSSDYPENFISIYVNYNESRITDKKSIMSHILINSVLRRYIKPSISKDELIFCAWIDYCKIVDDKDDELKKTLNVYNVNKIVDVALNDTPENLIQQFNIDLEYYKNRAKNYYLKYVISLEKRKNKEILKYAELAYNLTTNIDDFRVKKICKLIKENEIAVKTFCDILSYYSSNMKDKDLEKYGFNTRTIRRFKKVYNGIFKLNTAKNVVMKSKLGNAAASTQVQPSVQPVQPTEPTPQIDDTELPEEYNDLLNTFCPQTYNIPNLSLTLASYGKYIRFLIDKYKIGVIEGYTLSRLTDLKEDLCNYIKNKNKASADRILSQIIDVLKDYKKNK